MKKRGRFRTRFKKGRRSFYAIRNPDGTFADIQNIGRSVARDRRKRAQKKVKPGYGFRGDLPVKKRKR